MSEELKKEINTLEKEIKKSYSALSKKESELHKKRVKLTEKQDKVFKYVCLPYPSFSNKFHSAYSWHNPTRKIILSLCEEDGFIRKKWIIRLMYSSNFSYMKVKNLKEGLKICEQMKEKYVLEP